MEIIRWETPPPSSARNVRPGKYIRIAEALRQRRGEWAIISEEATASLASHINRGALKGFAPRGSYEAKVRVNSATRLTKRYTLYARYVG